MERIYDVLVRGLLRKPQVIQVKVDGARVAAEKEAVKKSGFKNARVIGLKRVLLKNGKQVYKNG